MADEFFDEVDRIYADFALPNTRLPLRFDEGERVMPPVPPWVASRRRLGELGHGPLYDALPTSLT